jgi:predicted transcriptional regulator
MINQDLKTRRESSTVSNFAKRHSFSLSTVYRLIADGDLTITKIRGLTRILDKDETLWLESVEASNKKSSKQSSKHQENS